MKKVSEFKILRVTAGYTQKELADLLNVKQATVSAWENCIAKPKIGSFAEIAKILNTNEMKIYDCFK